MKLKQTYKNHFELIGFNFILLMLFLGLNIFIYFFDTSLNSFNSSLIYLFLSVPILSLILFLRYIVYEDDAEYDLLYDRIVIIKDGKVRDIFIEDVNEIVFNGSSFKFEDKLEYNKLPFADFYYLEIGLKNGDWIAITNAVNINLLSIFREKYPSLKYLMNRNFYPIMSRY